MNHQQHMVVNNFPEDQFQREIEKLEASNQNQEEGSRKLESRAAQNLNLYFVFQAVILASTTMASSPKCHQWWIPFIVSLLAAIFNFFNFSAAMFKVLKSREELDQNLADFAFIKKNRIMSSQVNQVLPGEKINQQQGNEMVRPNVSLIQKWKRRLQVYGSMALFVGFTAVVMFGCYTTLCRSGDRKCVRIC